MGVNGDMLMVVNVGIYIIQVLNLGIGCVVFDIMEVFGQFEMLILMLDMFMLMVNCDNLIVMVMGIVINLIDFMVGEWMSLDGGNIVVIINGGFMVEVDVMGIYVLIVISNVSGCIIE